MESQINKKLSKFVYIFILISILISFFQFFFLGGPDFSLLTMTDRDKLLFLHPEHYDILYFAEDNTNPGTNLLFIDYELHSFAQPFFYPFRIAYYYSYENGIDDQKLLDYLKDTLIDYVVISESPFYLSTNVTLFTKLEMVTNPSNYILEVNKSAL